MCGRQVLQSKTRKKAEGIITKTLLAKGKIKVAQKSTGYIHTHIHTNARQTHKYIDPLVFQKSITNRVRNMRDVLKAWQLQVSLFSHCQSRKKVFTMKV